jgi:hypothetical protein
VAARSHSPFSSHGVALSPERAAPDVTSCQRERAARGTRRSGNAAQGTRRWQARHTQEAALREPDADWPVGSALCAPGLQQRLSAPGLQQRLSAALLRFAPGHAAPKRRLSRKRRLHTVWHTPALRPRTFSVDIFSFVSSIFSLSSACARSLVSGVRLRHARLSGTRGKGDAYELHSAV